MVHCMHGLIKEGAIYSVEVVLNSEDFNPLTAGSEIKQILLCLMPDNFTRQLGVS